MHVCKGPSLLMLINQINKLMEKSTCPHLRGFMQLLESECEKISYDGDVLFRVSWKWLLSKLTESLWITSLAIIKTQTSSTNYWQRTAIILTFKHYFNNKIFFLQNLPKISSKFSYRFLFLQIFLEIHNTFPKISASFS